MDEEVVKKLRRLQANKIKDTGSAVSFSGIINNILKKSLKV